MLRLGMRWGMAMALVFKMMVTDGHAKRLLETDGIELRGTARVVTYGAAVCNVVEASHTEAKYEQIKANHGQPLDVWQLDFSVYNGSGKWLDHLIARYGIESKWPPCTNWSGDGPGGGPSGTYSGPVEWASNIGHIQKSGRNVVAPGATLTATTFIIVFHEDPPPRFANWSVNFTFGEPVTAGGAETEAPAASRAASTAAQQPAAATPEQENLFWQSIVNSTNPAMFEAYLEQFPNGVFRALAQARLAALRSPTGDRTAGGSGSPAARAQPAANRDVSLRAGELREFDGMEFVWVPAGEFRMGSTSSEAYSNEQPVTQVRISQGFWLGKYEVTQAEWQGVMGTNPSEFSGCGQCPVEEVSWEDAQEFIRRLNAMDGAGTYRLPTEAEWEYAARAGTTGDRYAANLDAIAWCEKNSGARTHPVGGKTANAFGLHDMLGNVWEWVQDWAGGYPGGTVTDPRGPGSGSRRVIRGGAWGEAIISACRSSDRFSGPPGSRNSYQGFRLLRTVP